MKLTCPQCGRTIGDTDRDLDAHINCKRCGSQDIHARVANFNEYLKEEKDNDKS